MIDLLAGAAVVVSGILSVLAGVGLLRFPDALTRLHAAAKTATVGVIAAAAAAALEVDTVGTASLLILVVVLLFLSAPLGSSLLARAAYYDPDTPILLPGRNDLASAGPSTVAGEERQERPGAAMLLIGWLFVVWVALFASGTPGVVLGAVAIAGIITFLLPEYRPRWPRGVLKPVALARFTVRFLWSLLVANLDVMRSVVSRRQLRTSVVRFPLRVVTDTEVTLMMNAVTFTPGTVALDLIGTDLYVHVLDLRDETAFHEELKKLETSIIDAFGTPGERARVTPD